MPGAPPTLSQVCRTVLVLQLGGRSLRPARQLPQCKAVVLCKVGVAKWLLGRGHATHQWVLFAHLEWAQGRTVWTAEEGQGQSIICVMEKPDRTWDCDSGPAGAGAALGAVHKFCVSCELRLSSWAPIVRRVWSEGAETFSWSV